MTKEDIKTRLINNDALFKNIYVVEQQFDIVPEDRKHYGAAVSYQDIMELRSDFLEQLIDTVVDWVYSSEKCQLRHRQNTKDMVQMQYTTKLKTGKML